MMGHTKEKTTEIYLKAFENKTLDDASELLNLKEDVICTISETFGFVQCQIHLSSINQF